MTTSAEQARARTGAAMTEIRLSATARIARPAQRVWNLVANYHNDPAWRRGVRSMVPEPAGLVREGTTTDELMRLAGSTYRNLGTVTMVGPQWHFAWRTTKGVDAEGARTVRSLGPESCELRLELTVRVRGAQRLMAPVLAAMLRRNLNGDVLRLRALAEAG
jgi:uncharacterized membrane protein